MENGDLAHASIFRDLMPKLLSIMARFMSLEAMMARMNSTEILDPTKDWQIGPDMEIPHSKCAVRTVDDKILIMGG